VTITDYTLPSILTIHGTFNVVIRTFDDALVGLTPPTIQTMKSLGTLTKNPHTTVEQQQIDTLGIQVRDDYTVYAIGFWYKVFHATIPSELRITLIEGATELYYFFGTIDTLNSNWKSYYVADDGITRIRCADLTLLSSISKIYDLTVADYVTAVVANSLSVTHIPGTTFFTKIISINALFATLLDASGLNPTHAVSDVEFVFGDSSLDLQYTDEADFTGNIYGLHQLYVPVEFVTVGLCNYWRLATPETCLTNYYSSIQALISAMLKNFGVTMSIKYVLGVTNRYRIQLKQNWRAKNPHLLTMATAVKSEEYSFGSDLVGDAARATQLISAPGHVSGDPAQFVWMSAKYSDRNAVYTEPPNNVSMDFDVTLPFQIYTQYQGYATVFDDPDLIQRGDFLLCNNGDPAGNPNYVVNARFYSYLTASYIEVVTPTPLSVKMCHLIAGYNCFRFSSVASGIRFKKFSNTYGHITAAEDAGAQTFEAVDGMARIEIDDGLGSKNYFANKIGIDPSASELKIEWIQEEL
jgi:hypothetical protein